MTDRNATDAMLEDDWRSYLLGTHRDIVQGRRMFRLVPSEPRCKVCTAPFGGIGRLLVRPFGFVPWEKNPNVCRRCITTMSKRPVGGAEIPLSLLFADVRGSTSLAETMSPEDFGRLMNRFYSEASQALIAASGVVDKFVGDEAIGLFIPGIAGPEHAARAVEAARDLLVRTGHADANGPWIPVGVGVHTGPARVGLVGTVGGLLDFTALGDSVNSAARLASAAAAGEILVSDTAFAEAGLEAGVHERRELHLRGRQAAMGVHVLSVHDPVMRSTAGV